MSGSLDDVRLDVLVHEVRSPVAALAAIAVSLGGGPAVTSVCQEHVRLVLAACRAIERLVLDVAVASVRREPVDAGALVHESASSFAVRRANVVADSAEGPLFVDGDPVRLRQAIDNLIANALVHGVQAKAVTIRANRSADAVEIAVSDGGPGIAPDELDRMFELGVRLDDATPGSGIGLSLARAIVEAHGGTLVAASKLGEGSTFTIAIPARSLQPATRASRT